jgi:hypothetical protein
MFEERKGENFGAVAAEVISKNNENTKINKEDAKPTLP